MTKVFWKLIFVLCVVGSFCAISSYCWAITHTPLRHVMEDRVKPVVMIGSAYGPLTHGDACGDDWLCLVAWSNDPHPAKHKKGRAYAGAAR